MLELKKLLKPRWHSFRKRASTLAAKSLRLLPVKSERAGPKGHVKTKNWMDACGLNKYKAGYKEIYPKSKIQLFPPKTIDEKVHWTYRDESGKRPAAFVAEIPNGRLWANEWCTDSAVITPDDKMLSDLSFQSAREAKDNRVFSQWQMPPFYRVEGTVADLTAMASGYVYFHWMFDALPRIHLLRKSNLFNKVDRFIVNKYVHSFQKETLAILGVPEEKIIESVKCPYVKADKLLVPSLLGSENNMPGWACDFLRNAFLKNDKRHERASRRVYISRADSPGRKITNEDDVFRFLKGYGFEKYTLLGMPVSEQVELFASAEIVIAIQGSSLTNIVFCNKGTKVIEIYLPSFVEAWHWFIACHLGLEFYYLVGKGERVTKENWKERTKTGDILLDIDKLKQILELGGIRK